VPPTLLLLLLLVLVLVLPRLLQVYDVATGRLHHIDSDLGTKQQQTAGSY
jgi:hypothetical protein